MHTDVSMKTKQAIIMDLDYKVHKLTHGHAVPICSGHSCRPGSNTPQSVSGESFPSWFSTHSNAYNNQCKIVDRFILPKMDLRATRLGKAVCILAAPL